MYPPSQHLHGLARCFIRLVAEVGRGRGVAVLEEAGEEWLDEGAEDNLGAAAVIQVSVIAQTEHDRNA